MTGRFLVNDGGAIVFQPGIVMTVAKLLLAVKILQNALIATVMLHKIQMFLIHGLALVYGRLPQWVGLSKLQNLNNGIQQVCL